jgi:hypothetical protein
MQSEREFVMKKSLVLLGALTVAGCGMSESEQTRIAQAACAALSVTSKSQILERVQIVNGARQELSGEIYSGSGKDIDRYVRFGTCTDFLKNTDEFQQKTNRRQSALEVMVRNDDAREREGEDRILGADLVTKDGAYLFWIGEAIAGEEKYAFLDSETMLKVSNADLDGIYRSLWGYVAREVNEILEDSLTTDYEKERLEGEIINGKLEGAFTTFSADGYVTERAHYLAGKRNGSYEFWWNENQIMEKKSYVDDKLHGERLVWFGNGQLAHVTNYKNDVSDGRHQRWTDDGSLVSEVMYVDGKREGAGIWSGQSRCFKNDEKVDMSSVNRVSMSSVQRAKREAW